MLGYPPFQNRGKMLATWWLSLPIYLSFHGSARSILKIFSWWSSKDMLDDSPKMLLSGWVSESASFSQPIKELRCGGGGGRITLSKQQQAPGKEPRWREGGSGGREGHKEKESPQGERKFKNQTQTSPNLSVFSGRLQVLPSILNWWTQTKKRILMDLHFMQAFTCSWLALNTSGSVWTRELEGAVVLLGGKRSALS